MSNGRTTPGTHWRCRGMASGQAEGLGVGKHGPDWSIMPLPARGGVVEMTRPRAEHRTASNGFVAQWRSFCRSQGSILDCVEVVYLETPPMQLSVRVKTKVTWRNLQLGPWYTAYDITALCPQIRPDAVSRSKIPRSAWPELAEHNQTKTLRELAKDHGVSHEAVRRALRSVRGVHPTL